MSLAVPARLRAFERLLPAGTVLQHPRRRGRRAIRKSASFRSSPAVRRAIRTTACFPVALGARALPGSPDATVSRSRRRSAPPGSAGPCGSAQSRPGGRRRHPAGAETMTGARASGGRSSRPASRPSRGQPRAARGTFSNTASQFMLRPDHGIAAPLGATGTKRRVDRAARVQAPASGFSTFATSNPSQHHGGRAPRRSAHALAPRACKDRASARFPSIRSSAGPSSALQ